MKLLFIHGAPAAGKLTTARALLDRLGARLFDNHAAIDLARTVFEFDAPGFWELVQATRVLVLESALARGIPLLVMTFVYVDPTDLPTFERLEVAVQRGGGQLLPVYLQCSVDEIVRRVGNNDRAIRKKLTSEKGARDFLQEHRVAPVPRPNCLVLDSEANSAEANAQEIIRHFDLADHRT
jgi:shikimate kinase